MSTVTHHTNFVLGKFINKSYRARRTYGQPKIWVTDMTLNHLEFIYAACHVSLDLLTERLYRDILSPRCPIVALDSDLTNILKNFAQNDKPPSKLLVLYQNSQHFSPRYT